MSVIDYMIKMKLLPLCNGFVPTKIWSLIDWLDNMGINIWSYSIEDKNEIKDMEIVVLVEDNEGNKRYFETEITEHF